MLWFAYNALFVVCFTLLLPHYLYHMYRRGGYRRHFWQRLGRLEPGVRAALARETRIWIHAVSVGEVYVALATMAELRRRRPAARFVLSVTTSTGHAVAAARLAEEDVLLYFPVDLPAVMRGVLDAIRPRAILLVECELWPNLLRLAWRRGIPVVLINGRVSEHSYRGYRRLRVFTRRLLPAVDLLCVQTAEDARRLADLGAPPGRLHVLGSAKYEVAQPDPEGEQRALRVLRAAGVPEDAPVLLGGSTWAGEESLLLDLFRALRTRFPALVLVLAPRHAERTDEVLREIARRGARVVRRSQVNEQNAAIDAPEVFLIDTTGELRHYYPCADVIFIGKSLTQHGGQNVIEAALCGKAVVCGPNMENFRAVMDDFRAADALVQVANADALGQAVERLLDDPAARAGYGARAAALVRRNAGAITRTVDRIETVLDTAVEPAGGG